MIVAWKTHPLARQQGSLRHLAAVVKWSLFGGDRIRAGAAGTGGGAAKLAAQARGLNSRCLAGVLLLSLLSIAASESILSEHAGHPVIESDAVHDAVLQDSEPLSTFGQDVKALKAMSGSLRGSATLGDDSYDAGTDVTSTLIDVKVHADELETSNESLAPKVLAKMESSRGPKPESEQVRPHGGGGGDDPMETEDESEDEADVVPLPPSKPDNSPKPPLDPSVQTSLGGMKTKLNEMYKAKLDDTSNKEEGIDTEGKAEAFNAGLEALSSTISLVENCVQGGCEPHEVAEGVSSIISTIGGIVACFPATAAIGAVIQTVGALGSFISSFFGSPEVARAMPGLDADAVEAAAFRAVMTVQDNQIRAEFAGFKATLRTAIEFNVERSKTIDSTVGDTAKDKLVDGWFQQYHEYKWEDVVSRMKGIEKAYMAAYGDFEGSRRGDFLAWVKSSPETCKLEHYLEEDNVGRDNLNTCKKNTNAAEANYKYLKSFGGEYFSLSESMTSYYAGVVSILSKHSTCGKNMDKPSCHYYFRILALTSEVVSVVLKNQSALEKTLKSLANTCENPAPNTALWPFNQVCNGWTTKCNYQYLLFSTEADQAATVGGCEGGGCKMLVEEISNNGLLGITPGHPGPSDSTANMYCDRVVRNNCGLQKLSQDNVPVNTVWQTVNSGYTYKVMFDADDIKKSYFKQSETLIGKFTKFEGNAARFEGGEYCAPIRAPRTGIVEFIEDCDAEKLTIKRMEEPSTCVYIMVITGFCPCKNPLRQPVSQKVDHGFYGGVIGWKSGGTYVPSDSCSTAIDSVWTFNHDVSMFAIPAYTLDIPECVNLLQDSEGFGLEATDPHAKYKWVTKEGNTDYSDPKQCKDVPLKFTEVLLADYNECQPSGDWLGVTPTAQACAEKCKQSDPKSERFVWVQHGDKNCKCASKRCTLKWDSIQTTYDITTDDTTKTYQKDDIKAWCHYCPSSFLSDRWEDSCCSDSADDAFKSLEFEKRDVEERNFTSLNFTVVADYNECQPSGDWLGPTSTAKACAEKCKRSDMKSERFVWVQHGDKNCKCASKKCTLKRDLIQTTYDITNDDKWPKAQTEKWCNSCPQIYSVVGKNGGDLACWQEEIKTCDTKTAMTTIYENAVAAASMEGWGSGWSSSSGGSWNQKVEQKSCTERGFNKGELTKCFHEEYVNKGCLYD